MDEINYCSAPDGGVANQTVPTMTIGRGFRIVIASGVGFGAVGSGLGYALGVGLPEYYRGVFAAGQDPDFDPARVGLGLGFSQGVTLGLIVEMGIVLAVAIAGRPRIPS